MVEIGITNDSYTENNGILPQKYLVVDDEIAEKKSYRQSFIIDIGVSEELALFASSYDEALDIINSNSDIAICYVDCRIPKESNGIYNFEPTKTKDIEWGISLIAQINKILKKTAIAVYSAYTTITQIMEQVQKFENIVDCYSNHTDSNIQFDKKKLYIEAVQKLIPASAPSQLDILEEPKFDYLSLNLESRSLIQDKTKKIRKLLRRSAQDIIDIGKYLVEVKSHLQHGQFYLWLETEFQWSPASAARFMQAYRRLKSINLIDLTNLDVVPTALYILTAPEIPDKAVLEMKNLVQSGIPVNVKTAKSLKNKYKKQDTKQLSIVDDINVSRAKQPSVPLQTEAKLLNQTISDFKEEIPATKQSVVKIVSRKNKWQLKSNLIICAEPNSDKFIELLPPKISLCLCFPPQETWNFHSSSHYKSRLSFYSEYKDLDPIALLESIKLIVEISTSAEDDVVVCYIPHPQILKLIDKLGCRAYIAEPDYQKCLDLVNCFNNPRSD